MKSAIIGDEKDNKDPTKKTFEAGDKTLWGAYNALLDKDEAVKQWAQAQDNAVKVDANKYADDQDKAVKTEVANNLVTAKSELETSIATNLQSAKDYADQQDEIVANTAQANLSTTKTELTTSIATNLQSAKDYADDQDNAVKQQVNQQIANAQPKIASTTQAGIVKVDGTTVVINDGIISAVQGGQTLPSAEYTVRTWANEA